MLLSKKSREPDFLSNPIIHKLDLLLGEQVAQRKDLSVINALLKSLMADIGTQRQVDEYFEKDNESEYISAAESTSPQTEQKEHFKPQKGDIAWQSSQE